MTRPTAKRQSRARDVYVFRESAFYWFGHLEDHFNRRLLRAMRPERLTVGRWRCLAVLAEVDDLALGELAVHTVIDKPALTHVIDQMEADGLVERRIDDGDRRVIKVNLTEDGHALFGRMLPKAREVYARALDDVRTSDYKLMLTVLKRMAANLKD